MPFEDILPYRDFAIRIPQHAMYLLPTILQAVLAEPGRVSLLANSNFATQIQCMYIGMQLGTWQRQGRPDLEHHMNMLWQHIVQFLFPSPNIA